MFTETKTEKQCQIYGPGKSCKEFVGRETFEK